MSPFPLSTTQQESLITSNGRVNVWQGSIRSGKTFTSLIRFMIYVASAPRGGQIVIIARTRETAARNVFTLLQDASIFGPIADQVLYTPGAPTAKILGRTVFVIGASDAKAEKVLRGLTVAGAYVDEITVIPEEFFTQLLGRMSVAGAQLFGTTNPDNPAHWLKKRFLDRIPEQGLVTKQRDLADWRSFHFTMDANPNLTAEYIGQVSSEFTGLWFRRFIKGEWVAAEGAVYDGWDPDGATGRPHVIPWADLPPIRRLMGVAIDYGTQHPTVALMLALGYDRCLYVVDELCLDSTTSDDKIRYTDAEQSELLKRWIRANDHLPNAGEYDFNYLKPEWIIVDTAAASLREELSRDKGTSDGVMRAMPTSGAEKDVAYGIALVASLLAQRRLIIAKRDPESGHGCEKLLDEIPGYSWDPKAAEKGEDKPIKVADDAADSLRYLIATLEVEWRDEMETGSTW